MTFFLPLLTFLPRRWVEKAVDNTGKNPSPLVGGMVKQEREYMGRCLKRKSQAILTYAAVISFVVIALILMSGYIQRRVQGVYQQAGDSIGEGERLK